MYVPDAFTLPRRATPAMPSSWAEAERQRASVSADRTHQVSRAPTKAANLVQVSDHYRDDPRRSSTIFRADMKSSKRFSGGVINRFKKKVSEIFES